MDRTDHRLPGLRAGQSPIGPLRRGGPVLAAAVAVAGLGAALAGPDTTDGFRTLAPRSAARSGSLRATLSRLGIGGDVSARYVLARVRATDAHGAPLPVVRGARIGLLPAPRPAASPPEEDPPDGELYLSLSNVPEATLRAATGVVVELDAAALAPSALWERVPVPASAAAVAALKPWRSADGAARVAAAGRGTVTAVLGGAPLRTVTLTVVERSRRRMPTPGQVALVAPGLRQTRCAARRTATSWRYDASGVVAEGAPAPASVTVRFYAAAAVRRALKHHRFAFKDVRF